MTRALTYLRYLAGILMILGAVVALGRGAVWLSYDDARPGLSDTPQVFVWHEAFDDFGGYSGLIMNPDGTEFIAGSDRQHYLTGTLVRSDTEAVTDVTDITRWPVRMSTSNGVTRFQGDLEGLTWMDDGRIGLAFENFARIQILNAPGDLPRGVHRWDLFKGIFGNTVFEAIVTLPDGTLLALFERDPRRGQGARQTYTTTPAYRYDGKDFTGPSPFPVTKGFDVSGADLGPDDCLYVLERHYGLFTGFQFQLIRMNPLDWDAPRALLYRSKPMSLGNAEGVFVWQGRDGLVATLITDNGFPPLQPTRFIELPLRPAPDCADQ